MKKLVFCLLAIGSLNLTTASNEKKVATKTTTTKNYTYKVTTTNVLVNDKIQVHCTLIVIDPDTEESESFDLGNVADESACRKAAAKKFKEVTA
jgi:hypothetical protein